MKGNNLNGQRFNKLVAIGLAGNRNGQNTWLCRCDCGGLTIVLAGNLRQNQVKSCGCLVSHRHGKSKTIVYSKWKAMMNRCYRPTNENYPRYGGRGIEVCKRWHTFMNFYTDMGDPPKGLTLERKDVNGSYEPSNCKWATQAEQARNKTNNTVITINGKTQILAEWVRELGLDKGRVNNRLQAGWSVDDAFFRPVRVQRNAA
jgi:hypothetical protein